MRANATRRTRSPGRPSKFQEPSQPVTLTLPRRILNLLNQYDTDRAVAITRLVDQSLGEKTPERALVEVVEMAPGTGLIVVRSSDVLRKLPWLKLIEIAPQRYIITIETGVPVETLEVSVSDQIDGLPVDSSERALLQQLLEWIRDLRRGQKITKAELLLVSTAKMQKNRSHVVQFRTPQGRS